MHPHSLDPRIGPHRPWAYRHALVLACLLLFAACSPSRSYHAVLVLADLGAGAGASPLKSRTAAPIRRTIDYTVDGRRHRGDLYLPGDGAPRAAIVLVPGIVRAGNEDPRLVVFANTLARARFAVMTPDIPDFRSLQVRPGDARLIADALVYLRGRADIAPHGRVGIAALSYAVGLSLLAALEPEVRDRVRFILGVGGYYDVRDEIVYLSTGYRKVNGRWDYLRPDDYGKLVFVMGSLPHLQDVHDRATLRTMVARRLANPQADITALAPRLHADGRAIYDLVTNTDPARTPTLIAALPNGLRADLQALTLANKPLSRITAHVILVHGQDDDIIPYTQSLALARALPRDRVQLFVIHHVLTHVELSEQPLFSRAFWTEDLPDFWRMYRALDALLAQQDAASP